MPLAGMAMRGSATEQNCESPGSLHAPGWPTPISSITCPYGSSRSSHPDSLPVRGPAGIVTAARDPEESAPGKLAKNRRCKSPTGKVQPTTPTPSDARGSARESSREAFTGETTGRVLSCETGLIPRCRSSSLTRRQHLPWRTGLHRENLAQSKALCTWRSSLRGTWEASSVSGRACRTGS